MSTDDHRDKIEQARRELNRLALEFGMSDSRVLRQSIKLDALINEYIDVSTDKDSQLF
ncbi:aspartyl-phosphate phosphatase Spo0E family protein [Paenibacillus sp. 19GGS1-52]|uniref:Spo0E family sporulation regulatory protein-aspartic acid phosphatase n=1 Tax=Paenibacillus monticola TaxID=2666075 RepID=A0A7X2H9J5_9BACL|nr:MULTISPECIES: aspartyl-phosphate phosphatase Spo0E family protein [Paenibacillus]MRN56057.1 Spo0E family sporulation regulatory protein-aspartic acid phosphatase [Paenibacillus monticola]ULO08466.1 aspartyl-phosphate phosphatase Spo0E family protein [Paenibacillus sp. 19GGS1-52]